MAPLQHMVPRSNQDEEVCQSDSYYSGLNLGPCCHKCYVDSECFEQVLAADCGIVADTDTDVVDTEWRKHKDKDNMSWEP